MHPMERHVLDYDTPSGPMKLAYRDEGAGAPVLMLHGYFGEGSDWAHLPELGSGWRRIVPDLRGHGGSSIPASRFRFRDAATDMFHLLDHLGIERCGGIGLSGGGLTLLRMATMHPERITDMVLVSVCHHFPQGARAFMRSYADEGGEQLRALRERRVHSRDDLERLAATARAWSHGEDDATLSPDQLATITANTLVVAGEQDPLYPLDEVRCLAGSLQRAQLIVIPGGGHLPIFGAGRTAFTRHVEAFFADSRCAEPQLSA